MSVPKCPRSPKSREQNNMFGRKNKTLSIEVLAIGHQNFGQALRRLKQVLVFLRRRSQHLLMMLWAPN